jgi:sugar lactone lactonase YvrE
MFLTPLTATAENYTIGTFAGSGLGGFNGDNTNLTTQLSFPHGLTIDNTGNILIADKWNNRIRSIDIKTLKVTTVAGNGLQGFNGDLKVATDASLNWPTFVAVDSLGNLYISDSGNHCIRKVTFAPVPLMLSTFAGICKAGVDKGGYNGDGPAQSVLLNNPQGLSFSKGFLYIADSGNHMIRKVDTINLPNLLTTVVGTGEDGFSGDGGYAIKAQLNNPTGITLDCCSNSNLYIADTDNHRIRKVDTKGIITTVAGTGTAGFKGDGVPVLSAQLYFPTGVAIDNVGNLYIADSSNNRIRKADTKDPKGTITTVAGNGIYGFSGDGGVATTAQFSTPMALVRDKVGNLYVSDSYNNRVRKLTIDTPTDCDDQKCVYTVSITQAGFYITTATLPLGKPVGNWGLSVNTSSGSNAGGFNAGTVLDANGNSPSFIAFYLAKPEAIDMTVFEYSGNVPQLTVEIKQRDPSTLKEQIVFGQKKMITGQSAKTTVLPTGFYVLTVTSQPLNPFGRFGVGLMGSNFSGGVNIGGYIDSVTGGNGEGFGGFYVDSPQSVKFTLLYGSTYGSGGAGQPELKIYSQESGGVRMPCWPKPNFNPKCQ